VRADGSIFFRKTSDNTLLKFVITVVLKGIRVLHSRLRTELNLARWIFRFSTIGRLSLCLLLVVAPVTFAATAPKITQADLNSLTSQVTITGSGFGEKCAACELVANYGDFRYSLRTVSWQNDKIVASAPDLGANLDITLHVDLESQKSDTVPLRLRATLAPETPPRSLVSTSAQPDLQIFEYKSQDALGEKGKLYFDVSQPSPACLQSGYLFHDAALLMGNRTRFGQAQIIKKPEKDCATCTPLTVKYFFEPTGYLHLQIHVYRRKIQGICQAQLRK